MQVENLIEQDDGSAILQLSLTQEEQRVLLEIGVNFVLSSQLKKANGFIEEMYECQD